MLDLCVAPNNLTDEGFNVFGSNRRLFNKSPHVCQTIKVLLKRGLCSTIERSKQSAGLTRKTLHH
jgi:hypothetical protein